LASSQDYLPDLRLQSGLNLEREQLNLLVLKWTLFLLSPFSDFLDPAYAADDGGADVNGSGGAP
jgi:hypothetical protein